MVNKVFVDNRAEMDFTSKNFWPFYVLIQWGGGVSFILALLPILGRGAVFRSDLLGSGWGLASEEPGVHHWNRPFISILPTAEQAAAHTG